MNCHLFSNTPLGWHSDDEPLHGSIHDPYAILSLSMGCSRTFSIRPKDRRSDETKFLLSHGDLIAMNGKFQKIYQHRCVCIMFTSCTARLPIAHLFSVPPTKESCGPRINITFRWIMNHDLPRTGCGRKHMRPRRVPYIPFDIDTEREIRDDPGSQNQILNCLMETICI